MKAQLRLGRLNCHITIQSLDQTPTEDGAVTETPTTVCKCWASIEPLGGRELFIAREQQDTSTHCIRLHYRAGITPQMRALWNGRYFNFTSVINIGEINRELEIMAMEVIA